MRGRINSPRNRTYIYKDKNVYKAYQKQWREKNIEKIYKHNL